MRKIISFMHMSLDGFVAGPNGEMDWIKVNEEIFEYAGKRIQASDTALYGRVTFEMMENYWPHAGEKTDASKHDVEHSAWYNKVHKLVLSTTLQEKAFRNTTIINNLREDQLSNIKNQEGTEILLFGSPTATHSLLHLNLIDGFWIFLNPIILGKGIPLFEGMQHKIKLQLLPGRTFDCGVTELQYNVIQ